MRALLLVCVLVLSACTDRAARTVEVKMQEFAFVPAELRVTAGDTVLFRNADVVPHTATASGKWDTGTLAAGASHAVVMSERGKVDYVCALHPNMRATIEVR
jgi:plastocyanin